MIARPRRRLAGSIAFLVALLAAGIPAAGQQPAPPAPPQQQKPPPDLFAFDVGDWHFGIPAPTGLKAWAEVRWRVEDWSHLAKPGQDRSYDYQHVRVRQGVSQKWGPAEFGFEWQTVNLFGVDPAPSFGPGKTYRDANGNGSPQSLIVRQLWADLDTGGAFVRVGRQVYEDNAGLKYDDAAFAYVRERGNARLLGNLDWTAAGRTFDGVTLRHEDDRWLTRAWGFEANQGAFEVDHAGDSLDDVQTAGLELVSKRGAALPGTEVRGFGMVFRDDRNVVRAKYGDELFVMLVGGQVAARQTLGPGSADLYLWGAEETGDAGTQRLRAGAWVAEAGWRFDHAPLAPWLRVGHARGQGDSDPDDGEVNDFYNGLPTNHTYYGYIDLFALTNLRDSYVDLILDPHPQLRFVAGFHQFALSNGGSPVTFGSGAFNQGSLGYGSIPVTSSNLGQELDLTLRATTAGKKVWALLGYSHFWGKTAFERAFSDSDVDFAYLEIGFRL